ncbi:doublecortin domain-containing protein 2 [Grus japonensis]|uniref:Doublecortin domain-containing protein 2 n=1 Tax=Grus japonensis TaxID=30415 RepID=A0ABC9WEQ8_GRUJA
MVKSVLVYRNGDPFFPGRRIVINEKKVSNFEVFLKEVTGGVKAPFGAVRNIYTPRGGHRVRQLEELQSGEQYVAGGKEAFKKLNYLDIGETKKKPAEVNNEVKPVTHSRITVSARFRKPLQEPYTILLYTLDGKLVQNGSDLENGQIYVAVGREKFKKLPYGDLLFSKSAVRRPQGYTTEQAEELMDVLGGEDIYKASEERSEMWGAAEVQEDEDTRVEVPLDQSTRCCIVLLVSVDNGLELAT